MPTFTRMYTEPGVYFKVEDVVAPEVQAGEIVGCIIGTGKPTKTVSDRDLVPTVDGGLQLTRSGNAHFLDVPTPIIVEVAGYGIVNPQKVITFTSAQVTFDTLTGVVSLVTGTFSTAYRYTVVYTVNKLMTEGDFAPKLISSLSDAITLYGEISLTNGQPTFTLPLGASIFFREGGQLLYCVQLSGEGILMAQYTEALRSLTLVQNAYCLVPLIGIDATTNTAIATSFLNHVENMSSIIERKNRVAILAATRTTDDETDPTGSSNAYATFAEGLNSGRVAYICPGKVQMLFEAVDAMGLTIEEKVFIDGYPLAVAVAAKICNNNYTAGEPLTGKLIASVDDIVDIYSREQKNNMAGSGVLVIERNLAGLISIRHALSTRASVITEAEIIITRLKDIISIKTLLPTLEAIYINTRNLGAVTMLSIKTSVSSILDGFITAQDIVAYEDLEVVTNTIDPRQVDVSFKIRATWPITWIFIKFGVKV